jgi:hypothetical protein
MISYILALLIYWFNRAIDLMKYPLGIALFLSLPFLIPKLYEIIEIIIRHQEDYYPMIWGMGIYIVIWQIIFRNIGGGWFATLEHEFTHIIFALLTFHKITDLRASFSRGGHINYSGVGGGNWLITISPYFFPTFSALVLGAMYISKYQFNSFLLGALGFSIIYHIHSTYVETHYQQTDLQKVGFIYSWLFLPSANIVALIMILALIPNDRIYLELVMNSFYRYISSILKLFAI